MFINAQAYKYKSILPLNQAKWISKCHVPMLGEHIHCRRVVRAVTRVQGLHLGHEVEEEATHPLLTLWKPEEKMKEKDVQHFTCLCNDACSAALSSLQRGCNTAGRTLDVPALTEKQWRSVWGEPTWCTLPETEPASVGRYRSPPGFPGSAPHQSCWAWNMCGASWSLTYIHAVFQLAAAAQRRSNSAV